jgi:hypothetical protein
MNDEIQQHLLELGKQTTRQNELYEKSIEVAEKRAIECAKLKEEQEKLRIEIEKQNILKEKDIELNKSFNDTVRMLIEQNKITINEIELFLDKLASHTKDDPVKISLDLLLSFFQSIQVPVMIEMIKQLSSNDLKQEYIDKLTRMATEIGSARTNINQHSGMAVSGNFNSHDFKYAEKDLK